MDIRVRRALATLRHHPLVADTLLAVVLAAASLVSAAVTIQVARGTNPVFEDPGMAAPVVSMLLLCAPIAVRRRFPLAALAAVVGAFLLARLVLDVGESSMTVLVGSLALYSATVHGRGRLRIPVVAGAVALIAGEVGREVYFLIPEVEGKTLTQGFILLYNLAILSLPCALGATLRRLRDRQRELSERAAELEREREENARRAVFEERVRIARELHDVVAHHVSVMGVQAAAARRVLERQPAKAEEALGSIESASRQAVGELHQMLGFLRQQGEVDDVAPQPRLAELRALAEQLTQANLDVHLSVEGEEKPLPRTVEVSAYRIVQEALTNTVKHARATMAEVRIRYAGDSLSVGVSDNGSGRPVAPGRPAGHGLIGMRERVGLHGGKLRAGPRSEGGFEVEATFPLPGPV